MNIIKRDYPEASSGPVTWPLMPMKIVMSYLSLLPIVLTSCLFDFSTDDCERLTPVLPENAVLSNVSNGCGQRDFFKIFPGQALSIGYNGFDFGPGYDNLDYRWKFSTANLYDAGTNEPLGFEQTRPALRNGGGAVGVNTTTMDIAFYALVPDDQIGKGNFETTIEASVFNECGESTSAKARIEIVNTGNIIQQIRPDVPINISHHGQAYFNDKLYLLFGRRSVNDSKDNYVFDFKTRVWTKLPKIDVDNFNNGFSNMPTEQELFGRQLVDPSEAVQINNKMYFLNTGGKYMYVYDLNNHSFGMTSINNDAWSLSGMAKHVVINGKIYVGPVEIRGESPGLPNRNAIYVYDPIANTWAREVIIPSNLVTVPTVIGNPNRGSFVKVAYASGNTMQIVHENNQVLVYNTSTKQISANINSFLSTVIEWPLSTFQYKDDIYFFHKPTTLGTPLYRKANMTGSPQAVFNFKACPSNLPNFWHPGSRATVIGNSVIIVGGETFGAKRVWLNE